MEIVGRMSTSEIL